VICLTVMKLSFMPAAKLQMPLGLASKLKSSALFKPRKMQGELSTSVSERRPHETRSPGRQIVIFCLLFYKTTLSPVMPSCCKFHPSCSMYAKEAVERHGVRRGLILAARRLLRCRPFSAGGFDPVPDAE